jgi:hypothetical protein
MPFYLVGVKQVVGGIESVMESIALMIKHELCGG